MFDQTLICSRVAVAGAGPVALHVLRSPGPDPPSGLVVGRAYNAGMLRRVDVNTVDVHPEGFGPEGGGGRSRW